MTGEKTKKIPSRRPPWILGSLVLALLTMLVVMQSSNLWRSFSIESASDTLALYALLSLNFVAFIVFASIFARSLLKLQRERRAMTPGSKIKSRLLKYFFAISLLPIMTMAVFSYLFMNRALDRWFAQIPESVLRKPLVLQNQAVADQTLKMNETAQMLGETLAGQEITDAKLARIVERGSLTRLEVLSPKGEVLAASEKGLSKEQKDELDRTMTYVRQNKLNEPALSDGLAFDVAAAALPDGRRLIIVPDLRPENNVNQMVEKSVAEFDSLKRQQATARQIGISTLGLLTFMLIFASSWTALYIARGLTVPIKALAEGADEIAQGNLAHRVDAPAEDELALLVTAFNQMSSRLEANSSELSERRRYIETILQSLSTGVVSFDAANRVTTINRAAVKILKLENDNFENLALPDLVKEENRAVLEKLISRAKRVGQASEQTVLQRTQDNGNQDAGENVPVALSATTLPNAGGAVLVIEDLTELLNAQRASAWQEVARRMAHEIKNPLTPIQLSAERIAKRFARIQSPKSKVQSLLHVFGGAGEDRKTDAENQTLRVINEGTETILREVSSLKAMVDEFSRFARLPRVRLENGSIGDVAAQSVALYEDRFDDVKIETDLAENLPHAMIDAEQLRRVFVNLIENAIEAFDKLQTDKKIIVKTWLDARRDLIVCEISDNGDGIAPQNFQKLFQPYFSTKGRGTGLGLAIVQRIVIEHGGKIRAASNQPKGAKFIVELPVSNT